MSERMTAEEWRIYVKRPGKLINQILWDWQNDRVELLGLLRRLRELADPISRHEPGECEDCDLMREVAEELGDD